jgi:hypothetical protein
MDAEDLLDGLLPVNLLLSLTIALLVAFLLGTCVGSIATSYIPFLLRPLSKQVDILPSSNTYKAVDTSKDNAESIDLSDIDEKKVG